MSNIIGINGSPKVNKGASYTYLKRIINNIINSNSYSKKDMKIIKKSKIIVLSFPLYVDCIPSHFIRMLKDLENNKITNKNIYVICNLGFLEGIQGNITLEIIKNFCLRSNNNYMGGLAIGGGPIGYLKYPLINICIKNSLKKLRNSIEENKKYKDKFVSPLIPKFIYIKCANKNFQKQIKKAIIK